MNEVYQSPLTSRYAGKDMLKLFSNDTKFRTWRRLWIALAEAEHELGLPVTKEQIDELKEHKDDINYEVAIEREKRSVMTLCHMYMLMGYNAQKPAVLYILALLHVMSAIIPI